MEFKEYQQLAKTTAAYPEIKEKYVYPTLGLLGEAGEVAEKVKKIFRDNGGALDDDRRMMIKKELGDVLWYLSQIATEMNISLDDVAKDNIDKLKSRRDRGVISGDGDNR